MLSAVCPLCVISRIKRLNLCVLQIIPTKQKIVSRVQGNLGYVLVLIMQFYHEINYIFIYRPSNRPVKVENLTSAKIGLVPVFW
jgi:hypothetical protein